jgi:Flp pilus assembly pilin Flp
MTPGGRAGFLGSRPLEGHMRDVMNAVRHLARDEAAQDLLEYGLLAALIAVVATVAVTNLGARINTVLWQTIANNF